MTNEKIYVRINAITGMANDWGKKPVTVKEAIKLYYHFDRLAERAYNQWEYARERQNSLGWSRSRLFERDEQYGDVTREEWDEQWNAEQAYYKLEVAGLQWFNRYMAACDDVVRGLQALGYNFERIYFQD